MLRLEAHWRHDCIVGTAVYAACRANQLPLTLRDLAAVMDSDIYTLGKRYQAGLRVGCSIESCLTVFLSCSMPPARFGFRVPPLLGSQCLTVPDRRPRAPHALPLPSQLLGVRPPALEPCMLLARSLDRIATALCSSGRPPRPAAEGPAGRSKGCCGSGPDVSRSLGSAAGPGAGPAAAAAASAGPRGPGRSLQRLQPDALLILRWMGAQLAGYPHSLACLGAAVVLAAEMNNVVGVGSEAAAAALLVTRDTVDRKLKQVSRGSEFGRRRSSSLVCLPSCEPCCEPSGEYSKSRAMQTFFARGLLGLVWALGVAGRQQTRHSSHGLPAAPPSLQGYFPQITREGELTDRHLSSPPLSVHVCCRPARGFWSSPGCCPTAPTSPSRTWAPTPAPSSSCRGCWWPPGGVGPAQRRRPRRQQAAQQQQGREQQQERQ
jgi:hypothetical protein